MTMAAATATVVGCESGGSGRADGPSSTGEVAGPSREARPNVYDPDAAESEAVVFAGSDFEGTIYLSAGQDQLNADLYRARGSLEGAERLTSKGRISEVTASGETVVVSDARGSGSDRLEVANLEAEQALPGRVIDPHGQSPELSQGGKLLYSVPQYTDDGGDAGDKWFVTTPKPGAPKRLAMRARSSDRVGWAPGEKLGLLRRGSGALVVSPGTPAERSIDSGFADARFGFLTSSRGDVRFFGPDRKIAIVEPGGPRRVIDSPWEQLGSWSPDGRSLLVKRDDRIGRMSAKDGSVVEIGRVGNGKVFAAEWVAGEAP